MAEAVPIGTEAVPLAAAPGRILAASAHTDRPSPAADVSSMDGFALRRADLPRGRLTISGEVRVGHAPPEAAPPPGAGLRLATGSVVPAWADTIIKREDVHEHADHITFDPTLAHRLPPGAFIRREGENAAAGEVIAPAGTRITPVVIAALAACGLTVVRVHRALRLGILTTGDEVLDTAASPPAPWQLLDSNGPQLAGLLGTLPWVRDITRRHAPDNEPHIDAALADLLPRVDALLLSGGVSAGHRDLVPAALARAGFRPLVQGVAQRPGRPLLAGITPDGRPILALPGNPVSVLATATRIALPVLARRAGAATLLPRAAVLLSNPDTQALDLWWHRPVRLTADGHAQLLPTRGSGDIIAAARSHGFVELPPGASGPGPWPYYTWGAE